MNAPLYLQKKEASSRVLVALGTFSPSQQKAASMSQVPGQPCLEFAREMRQQHHHVRPNPPAFSLLPATSCAKTPVSLATLRLEGLESGKLLGSSRNL